MKKLLTLLLVVAMAFTLVGCGSKTVDEPVVEETTEADVRIAMVTDYGDITDQSFNQTTYEACKAYAESTGLDFKYYKPVGDSDDARIASIDQAVEEGYNVIVMPGYAFAAAAKKTSAVYPDVKFIALDVSEFDLDSVEVEGYTGANLYSAVYQEEIAGFMAGYAAVKMGYTKLGFLGGMAVPAVIRYGYGFVQGADYAAVETGAEVSINYVYGGQFFGDADITAVMDVWYGAGTEVVFACGGGIFTSACEAAVKAGGKVIGVDVDQLGTITSMYGDETLCVTSAMKGLANTVKTALSVVEAGEFDSKLGGKIENLGMVSADPYANYVGLPETTAFNDTFTADDLAALSAAIFSGDVKVSNAVDAEPTVSAVTVDYQGAIK